MTGVAALLAALSTAIAQPQGGVHRLTALTVLRAPAARVLVLPAERRTPIRSCSVQRSRTSGAAHKVLPVACEQPPRSSVNVPNAATGGVATILGG